MNKEQIDAVKLYVDNNIITPEAFEILKTITGFQSFINEMCCECSEPSKYSINNKRYCNEHYNEALFCLNTG